MISLHNDYVKVGLLTILLDVVLLWILFQSSLVVFDRTFIVTVLMSHALFFYALLYDIHSLIDSLHVIIFFYLNAAVFVKNKWLLGLNLFLITTIQILWVIEERCILNREPNQFGYAKSLSIYVLLLTIVLSMKLGWTLFTPTACSVDDIIKN